MAIKLNIYFIANISAGNRILAFIEAYMRVFTNFISIRPFAYFIMALFKDSNDVKISFLSLAITEVAILPTEPSTLAFCLVS